MGTNSIKNQTSESSVEINLSVEKRDDTTQLRVKREASAIRVLSFSKKARFSLKNME